MDAQRMISTTRTAIISLTFAMLLAACKSAPLATDDASLNAKVTSSLAADQNLKGQSIQASVDTSMRSPLRLMAIRERVSSELPL